MDARPYNIPRQNLNLNTGNEYPKLPASILILKMVDLTDRWSLLEVIVSSGLTVLPKVTKSFFGAFLKISLLRKVLHCMTRNAQSVIDKDTKSQKHTHNFISSSRKQKKIAPKVNLTIPCLSSFMNLHTSTAGMGILFAGHIHNFLPLCAKLLVK